MKQKTKDHRARFRFSSLFPPSCPILHSIRADVVRAVFSFLPKLPLQYSPLEAMRPSPSSSSQHSRRRRSRRSTWTTLIAVAVAVLPALLVSAQRTTYELDECVRAISTWALGTRSTRFQTPPIFNADLFAVARVISGNTYIATIETDATGGTLDVITLSTILADTAAAGAATPSVADAETDTETTVPAVATPTPAAADPALTATNRGVVNAPQSLCTTAGCPVEPSE